MYSTCLSSVRESVDMAKNFVASLPVIRPSPSNTKKKKKNQTNKIIKAI